MQRFGHPALQGVGQVVGELGTEAPQKGTHVHASSDCLGAHLGRHPVLVGGRCMSLLAKLKELAGAVEGQIWRANATVMKAELDYFAKKREREQKEDPNARLG